MKGACDGLEGLPLKCGWRVSHVLKVEAGDVATSLAFIVHM